MEYCQHCGKMTAQKDLYTSEVVCYNAPCYEDRAPQLNIAPTKEAAREEIERRIAPVGPTVVNNAEDAARVCGRDSRVARYAEMLLQQIAVNLDVPAEVLSAPFVETVDNYDLGSLPAKPLRTTFNFDGTFKGEITMQGEMHFSKDGKDYRITIEDLVKAATEVKSEGSAGNSVTMAPSPAPEEKSCGNCKGFNWLHLTCRHQAGVRDPNGGCNQPQSFQPMDKRND